MNTTTANSSAPRAVTSLSAYCDAFEAVWRGWTENVEEVESIWFRGQVSASWQLVPTLYRSPYSEVEGDRYRHDFFLRSRPFLEEATSPPASEWDWYFLMQHYGVPTRLLDFTESALAALYFATVEGADEANACVWILHPVNFNAANAGNGGDIPAYSEEYVAPYLPRLWDRARLPDSPMAIDPPYNSRRLVAQRGKFVVFGESRLPLDQLANVPDFMCRIDIPGRAKRNIRRQLLAAGISESVLFPGLPGLSREIREAYTVDMSFETPDESEADDDADAKSTAT
jgi:hypothetical protein